MNLVSGLIILYAV